jgi:putative FmdB family regulatory protein
MPRYTYICNECESVLNVIHLMKEKLQECSECGSEDVKKIPSQMAAKIRRETKVGDAVKEGIRENTKILEELKKESRKDFTVE